MSIKCILGSTLKKLMHARVVSEGGDFSLRTVFTDEDFAAAAVNNITREQCLGWVRHLYERHPDIDGRKLHLIMNELSDKEVCNQCLIDEFDLLHLACPNCTAMPKG